MTSRRQAIAMAAGFATAASIPTANAQGTRGAPGIPASPAWSRALPTGPDTRVRITEAYTRLVARDAYFWAWPLVNMYNRRLAFARMTEIAYAGPLPQAPLNRLTMLTDYVAPEQRNVACPRGCC